MKADAGLQRCDGPAIRGFFHARGKDDDQLAPGREKLIGSRLRLGDRDGVKHERRGAADDLHDPGA